MKSSDNSTAFGHASPSSHRAWPTWRRVGRRQQRFQDREYPSEKDRQNTEFDITNFPRIKKEFSIFLDDQWEIRGGPIKDHHLLAVLGDGEREVVLVVNLKTFPHVAPHVFLLPGVLPYWTASSTIADYVYETIRMAADVKETMQTGKGSGTSNEEVRPMDPEAPATPEPIQEQALENCEAGSNLLFLVYRRIRRFWATLTRK